MARLLVTGAKGAIGRHVVAEARRRGHIVAGVGHGNWDSDPDLPAIDHWLNGEVTPDTLSAASRFLGEPDAVIHLAGGSAVGPSIANPAEDFRRTVIGGQTILDWLSASAPKARLAIASSAAVYGDGHARPIPESAPLNPTSPYGAHKAAVEIIASSRAREFGLHVSIVRLFSVFGPGMRKQLVWEIGRRLLGGEQEIHLGGTGNESRDFIAVADAAAILLAAVDKASNAPFVVNGCSGAASTVREIAEKLCASFAGVRLSFSGKVRKGDPQYLVGDPAAAVAANLAAPADIDEKIAATLDWIANDSRRRLRT